MKKLTIEEIKSIQFNILMNVASFCDNNKIRYYLCGGTLIGAVRHKGYIPWDDDIDIEMPRADYNRFIQVFGESEKYKVLSIETDKDYYQVAAKVVDTRTVLIEDIDIENKIGVYIDVFPIDNIPDSSLKQKKWFFDLALRRWILQSKTISISNQRSFHKNLILQILKYASRSLSYRELAESINKISQIYRNEVSSKSVGVVSTMIYGKREIMCRNWFADYTDLVFENHVFHCPIEYDCVLRQLYGEYMKLPPASQQISHHKYEAYILEE